MILCVRWSAPVCRWNYRWGIGSRPNAWGKGMVYTCWHRGNLAGTCSAEAALWRWPARIFDGEYITRILLKLGYGLARGQAAKRPPGVGEMIRCHRQGLDTVLPSMAAGPAFVAKPGSCNAKGPPSRDRVSTRQCAALRIRKSSDQTEFPLPLTVPRCLWLPICPVTPIATNRPAGRKVQSTLDNLRTRAEQCKRSVLIPAGKRFADTTRGLERNDLLPKLGSNNISHAPDNSHATFSSKPK